MWQTANSEYGVNHEIEREIGANYKQQKSLRKVSIGFSLNLRFKYRRDYFIVDSIFIKKWKLFELNCLLLMNFYGTFEAIFHYLYSSVVNCDVVECENFIRCINQWQFVKRGRNIFLFYYTNMFILTRVLLICIVWFCEHVSYKYTYSNTIDWYIFNHYSCHKIVSSITWNFHILYEK